MVQDVKIQKFTPFSSHTDPEGKLSFVGNVSKLMKESDNLILRRQIRYLCPFKNHPSKMHSTYKETVVFSRQELALSLITNALPNTRFETELPF
jgi:hypothetical protein